MSEKCYAVRFIVMLSVMPELNGRVTVLISIATKLNLLYV